MYEKMKYLVAEDGIAPSAYHRQVNCDLCHIPPSLWPGRCVMREDRQERERRDDMNGLQAVSLYLPHDTILRLFPLSRYCHFAGVLT